MEARRVVLEMCAKLTSNSCLGGTVEKATEQITSLAEEELQKENNPLTICKEEDTMEDMFQIAINEEKRLFPEWFEGKKLLESFDEYRKKKVKLSMTAVSEPKRNMMELFAVDST